MITINACILQDSILGSTLFLIYFNDLSDHLQGNLKLVADDTPLVSFVKVPDRIANNLNNNLKEINKWAFLRKMSLKPDPTEEAQDIIFGRKTAETIHPKIFFNNILVNKVDFRNIWGCI